MKGERKKPDGGFVSIPAMAFIAAWWAYRRGYIGLVDFRVWLACFELRARRSQAREGTVPEYKVEELRPLVGGVGGEHSRASLRRLRAVGLIRWSLTSVEAGMVDGVEKLDTDGELDAKRTLLTNHRRNVPVPRRMLCFMCKCRRPVLLATWAGHLLRCLYHRGLTCRPTGLCKASWIAEVFEVDARNVKAARAVLVEWGMLVPGTAPQWVLNRHGLPVTVNLAWDRDRLRKPPPLGAISTTGSPPPRETGNSVHRSENQQPERPQADGVRTRTGRGGRPGHVTLPMLRSVSGIDLFWQYAAERGYCGRSESDRLRVFGAAAHALRVGQRNPCGLFATVVRRRLWSHISLEDEDRGRRGMRTWRE